MGVPAKKMRKEAIKTPSNKVVLAEICDLIGEMAGIQLAERHYHMIQGRLQRRLLDLKINSLAKYLDYFYTNREVEGPKLVSLLTTHHTYFFREFLHFEYLIDHALPKLIPTIQLRSDRTLRVWSAGCSRGQEVYSLGMFLDFHLKRLDPTLRYEILGTDLDQESIAFAENGVYHEDELKEVPLPFLDNHWARGKEDIASYMKAKDSLRKSCKFRSSNLLEPSLLPPVDPKFDLIFCRNVFIYFESSQIAKIAGELVRRLSPEGFLFIGISETLMGLSLPVKAHAGSIYTLEGAEFNESDLKLVRGREKSEEDSSVSQVPPVLSVVEGSGALTGHEAHRAPLRIVCVDDSPSILSLLGKILQPQNGFEVVGTARGGKEAVGKIRELQPDAVTLDIHMSDQNGLDYLSTNLKPGHPPVVMISSVSRDDTELAGKALSLGASDYIEKPAFSNLADRGEEIRTKLRCAVMVRSVQTRSFPASTAKQSEMVLKNPEDKLRVIVFQLSSKGSLKTIFSSLRHTQPPCILMIEGGTDALSGIAEFLSKELGKTVIAPIQFPATLRTDEIYLFEAAAHLKKLRDLYGKNKRTSIMVLGEVTKNAASGLRTWSKAQFILEEVDGGRGAEILKGKMTQVVPITSFGYLSDEFLCQSDNENLKK
jgi:chemotaxis protein methyltransferase CheR